MLYSNCRWWKDLDFATKLPFARDRIVECYFWIVSVYFEPQYSLARKIHLQVANAWKDINEVCIRPTVVPMPLLMCCLNLTGVLDVIYKEGDNYTHVGKEMKDNVALVLIDPIPI